MSRAHGAHRVAAEEAGAGSPSSRRCRSTRYVDVGEGFQLEIPEGLAEGVFDVSDIVEACRGRIGEPRPPGVPSTARMTVDEMVPLAMQVAHDWTGDQLFVDLGEMLEKFVDHRDDDSVALAVEMMRFIATRRGGITMLRTWLAEQLVDAERFRILTRAQAEIETCASEASSGRAE